MEWEVTVIEGDPRKPTTATSSSTSRAVELGICHLRRRGWGPSRPTTRRQGGQTRPHDKPDAARALCEAWEQAVTA
jgi:hypothetical protein